MVSDSRAEESNPHASDAEDSTQSADHATGPLPDATNQLSTAAELASLASIAPPEEPEPAEEPQPASGTRSVVSRADLSAIAAKSREKRGPAEERVLGTNREQRTFLQVIMAATIVLLGWQWFQAVNDVPDGVSIERGAYFRVDINTDDWRELDVLQGIGETLAKRIVEYRRTNGRFEELNDLEDVPGIGPITVERLKPWIKVTEPYESASKPQQKQ